MRSPTLAFGATLVALVAFAANSLLCRLALSERSIDPATFTAVRIASGALVLATLALLRRRDASVLRAGDLGSASALFAYAILFAGAYVVLPTGTGALLLFGAVQTTMLTAAVVRGERPGALQALGIALALGGLVALVAPGLGAPPLLGALAMLGAGVAWGAYSLRGRGGADPLAVTAGNFARALPLALVPLGLVAVAAGTGSPFAPHASVRGLALAAASGGLASGIGYAIWYAALPRLTATRAAVVQLTVPVIAALGGVLWLGEIVTPRLALSTVAILGGVALGLRRRR